MKEVDWEGLLHSLGEGSGSGIGIGSGVDHDPLLVNDQQPGLRDTSNIPSLWDDLPVRRDDIVLPPILGAVPPPVPHNNHRHHHSYTTTSSPNRPKAWRGHSLPVTPLNQQQFNEGSHTQEVVIPDHHRKVSETYDWDHFLSTFQQQHSSLPPDPSQIFPSQQPHLTSLQQQQNQPIAETPRSYWNHTPTSTTESSHTTAARRSNSFQTLPPISNSFSSFPVDTVNRNNGDHSNDGFYRRSTISTIDAFPSLARIPSPASGDAPRQSQPPSQSASAAPTPLVSQPTPNTLADSEDKRVRNTVASAKFRAKRRQHIAEVTRTVQDLEGQKQELERDVQGLKQENGLLREMVHVKYGLAVPKSPKDNSK